MRGRPESLRAPSMLRRSNLSLAIALLLLPWPGVAEQVQDGFRAYERGDFAAAFRLLAPAATEDEPGLQNLVAMMHYLGRGTDADPAAAHALFHQAAINGSLEARRNLGVLHTLGAPGVKIDFEEARIWFATAQATGYEEQPGASAPSFPVPDTIKAGLSIDPPANNNGRRVYLMFCSGCHGFSGMHFFRYAPSFAMGQRLMKSDAELLTSILKGKGLMPSWEDKLPLSDLQDALQYLRLLSIQTAYGVNTAGFDDEPDMYFIFYPRGAGQEDMLNPHVAVEDDF